MDISIQLKKIKDRYDQLNQQLAEPSLKHEEMTRLSREISEIEEIAKAYETHCQMALEISHLTEMINDPSSDAEMKELAESEKKDLEIKFDDFQNHMKILLLPKDEADARNAILEVRAGTGGDEAALFAANLFEMYQRYSALQGWRFQVIDSSPTPIGGLKEARAEIAGVNVFAKLKFESGVHRVQRVPKTETSGRIHTSAATVAVLPEAEEVDIDVQEKDLRVETFRASGAGGQHVNTTDSAVRITHIPTGIVVSQQDEKSQHKNRAKAFKILRARLYQVKRDQIAAEQAATRKSQVGSGDRSERIRTYNFPQSRVTDHRINLTLHKLEAVLIGEALDEMISELITHDQALKLAEIAEE